MRWLALLLLALSTPALAEENTYAPDFCEFAITFPDDPYTSRRCDGEDETRCYEQISYTKVFDMESTVNFRVICNPIDESVINSYSGEVMQATLRAMTQRSVVETFDTSFREEEHYKQAGLVGEGKSGKLATLYIAQLWIGKKSAFSVEAELIGNPAAAPDELFSQILKSVKYKEETPKTEETPENPKETTPKE